MCGIAGIFGDEGSPPAEEPALAEAAAVLAPRGPDGSNVWTEGPAGLAHTRLAIIDRAHGEQPMFSEDGRYVVVFNGEIYNHHELRRQLAARGYPARTKCDTEVLLYLYDWLGSGMVDRLRGMFAFAIYDRELRRAFLARDRFGKKPLYLSERSGRLYFASTLDAVAALLPAKPELDYQALAEYLVLQYVPAPLSAYRGVSKLSPGHRATWSEGSLDIDRYWIPPARSPHADLLSEEAVVEGLRRRIAEASAIRLESEVPLGVFLSGGLDSSTVVAELALAGITPRTFSMGFDHPDFDETEYAQEVAERFGTNHQRLVADDDIGSVFQDFTMSYDEPFADSSALATLAIARAASDEVTVVLTGEGGDELLGGYERYRRHRKAVRLRSRIGPIAAVAGASARAGGRVLGHSKLERIGRWVGHPWETYRDGLFRFSPEEAAGLVSDDMRGEIDFTRPVSRLDGLKAQTNGQGSSVMWIDEQTYLPDDVVTKMDRATMAHGVEARSPLLDHEFAEWCAGIPEAMLIDWSGGKNVVRRAYEGVLPDSVLNRGKMGFGVPIAAWMRNELRGELGDLVLSRSGPLWSWLSWDAGTKVADRFLHGDDQSRTKVWNLLALAGWASARAM
ncbi:MAG: asparagine synthase (glutamine-hydrolyzing) [Actinomycetota bacterium]